MRIDHLGRLLVMPSSTASPAKAQTNSSGRKLTAVITIGANYTIVPVTQCRRVRRLCSLQPKIRLNSYQLFRRALRSLLYIISSK